MSISRRDQVRALLAPQPLAETPGEAPARVPSRAVRAMGLEMRRLTEEATEAAQLRARMESGDSVIDLDPALVDPSPVADRLEPRQDSQYQALLDSIRTAGQLLPILVRPHPDREGRYQIACGHRRRHAALDLGMPVRAIVRRMTDAELVVAQGKENAERRDLSFIERALFALHLRGHGFDRATINAALAVQTSETTRLLAVAESVPGELIRAIGPAPRAGRPRWMELAALLAHPGAGEIVAATLGQPAFQRAASDARFDLLFAALRTPAGASDEALIHNRHGRPVIRIRQTDRATIFTVDVRAAPGLGLFLRQRMAALVEAFEAEQRGGEQGSG
jgi:ParB family chromosome partitioning protein